MAKQLWRKGGKLLYLPSSPGTLMYSEACCCEGGPPIFDCPACPLAQSMQVSFTVSGAAAAPTDSDYIKCGCLNLNGLWIVYIDHIDANGDCKGFVVNPNTFTCPNPGTPPPDDVDMSNSGSAILKKHATGLEIIVNIQSDRVGGGSASSGMTASCFIPDPYECIGVECDADVISGCNQGDAAVHISVTGTLKP